MLKRIMIIFAALIPLCASGQDTSTDAKNGVLNQLSSELVECAVYYHVNAACVSRYPDPRASGLANNMRNAAGQLLDLALETGRPAGKSPAGLEAQSKLLMESMSTSINKSCANVSILMNRYADFCKQLTERTDLRLSELLAGRVCDGSYRCE